MTGSPTPWSGLSHWIHAHPEVAFEEQRSAHRVAVPHSATKASTSRWVRAGCPPPSSPGWVAAPSTSGSAPSTTPCPPSATPAATTSSPPPRSAPAWLWPALADDLGLTVSVLGTPAEEGGGGKILMLERGGFEGVHAAMMVHPSPHEQWTMPCLAVSHLDVHYHGKAAHASAYPEEGINAADAITVAQTAIGLLRQHLRPSDRIHGIVTHGGDAPNIVPAETTSKWYIRARNLAELADLEPRGPALLRSGGAGDRLLHGYRPPEPALFGDDARTVSSAPCTRPTPRPGAGSSRRSYRPRPPCAPRVRPTWPMSR